MTFAADPIRAVADRAVGVIVAIIVEEVRP